MLKQVTLFLLLVSAIFALNGYDPNFWTPDLVNLKHDPFDLISSNFGQPAGNYNWYRICTSKLLNRIGIVTSIN